AQKGGDLRLLSRLRRTNRVPGDSDHPIAFAEEIQRFGCFLGEADDAIRVFTQKGPPERNFHYCVAGETQFVLRRVKMLYFFSVRSVNTKPSRSTTTPVSIGIGLANIGPAYAQVWNSPRSAQRSTPSGKSARSCVSNSRPAKDRSSCFGFRHVIRARRPL